MGRGGSKRMEGVLNLTERERFICCYTLLDHGLDRHNYITGTLKAASWERGFKNQVFNMRKKGISAMYSQFLESPMNASPD
jgi:hypothetical protein